MQLPEPIHPGLPNAGQQVCFLNALMQCLAHVPALADCLARDCLTLCCTQHEADLVISVANLLQALSAAPDDSSPRCVMLLMFIECNVLQQTEYTRRADASCTSVFV